MRKGAKRIGWTTGEVEWLLANAGRVPLSEMCLRLKRSRQAVYSEARHLRDAGHRVELRYHVPRLALCPSCGCNRATLGSTGICAVCTLRERLASIKARQAELWPLLSPEDREMYERTDSRGGSRRDRPPKAPDVTGMGPYRAARAIEAWEAEVEAVEVANLRRAVKAAQKRKERMEARVPLADE